MTDERWQQLCTMYLAGERLKPLDWQEFYTAYLQKPHWQKTKHKAWCHFRGECQRCSGCEDLQCHHTNYKYLFREVVGLDVVLLCDVHHAEQHWATKRYWHSQIYNPYVLSGGRK